MPYVRRPESPINGEVKASPRPHASCIAKELYTSCVCIVCGVGCRTSFGCRPKRRKGLVFSREFPVTPRTTTEDVPSVFFVLHPQNPCQYDKAADPSATPSLWAMPEVQRFAKEFRLKAVAFDQGALGHQQPKPKRLLTTSWVLYKILQGQRVPPQSRKPVLRPKEWQERFQQSRSWAEWAPRLSQAVVRAWEEHQKEPSHQLEAEQKDKAILKAISPFWEAHFHQDHRPFRRDCAVRLEASARQRPYYRQDRASVFTMSIDIAGPCEKGVDSDAKTRHRYLLVATYAVPLMKDGEFVWTEHKDATAPDCEEFVEDLEAPPEAAVDPLPEPAEGNRYSRVQQYIATISQPLKIKTLVICEPIPSRRQQDVRLAATCISERLFINRCMQTRPLLQALPVLAANAHSLEECSNGLLVVQASFHIMLKAPVDYAMSLHRGFGQHQKSPCMICSKGFHTG